jgi:hypothetical protein
LENKGMLAEFQKLLVDPSAKTIEIIKGGIEHEWFRSRLVRHFPEDLVQSLIKILEQGRSKDVLELSVLKLDNELHRKQIEIKKDVLFPDKGEDKSPKIRINECYIDNSGLVILWPYLTKFFELCDLVKDNRFIDKEKKYRAIHLLHYLVFGELNHLEYHFPLNKLLCGLDIQDPIPMEVNLLEKEMTACEDLLKAVIKNWEALKNTSVAGFRETFLKREGKLTRKGDEWLLKVEQKGYDILMDKLPWSISMVKLPWNNELIHVEW